MWCRGRYVLLLLAAAGTMFLAVATLIALAFFDDPPRLAAVRHTSPPPATGRQRLPSAGAANASFAVVLVIAAFGDTPPGLSE